MSPRDLPLRWKVLLPFAALSLAYGCTGTFIFARATAAEARAAISARLRDAAVVATDSLRTNETALAQTARLVAGTAGVAGAIDRADEDALARLVLPVVVNAATSAVRVATPDGRRVLEAIVSDGEVELAGAGPWFAPAAEPVQANDTGLASVGTVRDAPALVVRMPVLRDDEAGAAGSVSVAQLLRPVLADTAKLTRTRISLAPAGAERAVETARDGALGLDVPVTIGGRPAAALAISVPAPSGLGALGAEAWKVALLAFGALIGVFVAGALVSRWISRPVSRLVRSTRVIGSGDLTHRTDNDARDEIGELAVSFNDMAEALESARADLEGKVRQRTSELHDALGLLDAANAELQRAYDTKSAFLANVSHELRNPLNGILVAAQVLGSRATPITPHRTRRLGGMIVSNGRLLLDLLNDLLDASRIEAGRLDIVSEPASLGQIIHEAEQSVRPLAMQKRISLKIGEVNGRIVHADATRLRQSLLNLLSNAVKFTPPGGRVHVGVKSSADRVAIAVTDTGPGIPAEHLERIFKPFEQARSDAMQGAGLGLAIARGIAEAHGGSLTATSTPGKGSTLTIAVPGGAASA